MPTIRLTVTSGDNSYQFVASLHKSRNAKERFLETEFYLRGGSVPKDGVPHFEVEILSPDTETLRGYRSHIHVGKNRNPFMCYPAHLPSKEEALQWFKAWSAGTILDKETGIDLNIALNAVGGSREKLFEMLKDQHSIEVLETEE